MTNGGYTSGYTESSTSSDLKKARVSFSNVNAVNALVPGEAALPGG